MPYENETLSRHSLRYSCARHARYQSTLKRCLQGSDPGRASNAKTTGILFHADWAGGSYTIVSNEATLLLDIDVV